MAKDPAFLFYPGDYLRDTQCLSEKVQVAYDRIMCEHMRNICKDVSKIGITKDKLNFFTKRLNEDEKNDLMSVLVQSGDIFQIEWVAISICKRKNYSDGRAENRRGKNKEHMKSYDSHMEIENEIVNEDVIRIIKQLETLNKINIEDAQKNYFMYLVVEMSKMFLEANPDYFFDKETDYSACLQIAYKIALMKKWARAEVVNGKMKDVLESWRIIIPFINSDSWLKNRSLMDISQTKEWQRLVLKMKNSQDGKLQGQTTSVGKTIEFDRP